MSVEVENDLRSIVDWGKKMAFIIQCLKTQVVDYSSAAPTDIKGTFMQMRKPVYKFLSMRK